ncbi:uncharacterized protein LOC116348124 [Contarinia nasturtii]|uniref:uncharacterized protein LOC116348123 n=1 Tax=Contarinia nasturtii TaxID=265458 RepID=UPI0012D4530E|nr:uncharacterized protein LOC116348123 [Contarinia nasturtii]XP_031634855.1 uncharacterized protein LOC116348124 [Contarinia nasturtii]
MSHLIEFEERESAFQNRLHTFGIINRGHKEIEDFFEDAFFYFDSNVKSILDDHYLIKVSVCLHAIFEKKVMTSDGVEECVTQPMYLHTNMEIVDFETELKQFYDEYIVTVVQNRISEIELRGSGFTLKEIIDMETQTSSYDPYNGASYMKLPKKLENKKAIINVQNKDEKCFMYAILSALHSDLKNPQRVKTYKNYLNELNFEGLNFPIGLKELKKFEQQNSTISVNVYMWSEKNEKVRPLRLTKNVKANHVHLLLLSKNVGDTDGVKTHYCWIKNLSALIGKQISKNCRKKLFCDRCLNHFVCFQALEQHKMACMNQNECQIIMPIPGVNDSIQFVNFQKQIPVEFVVYADVESVLRTPNDDEKPFDSEKTETNQKHDVFSIGYFCAADYGESKYHFNRGANCIEWFVNEMENLGHAASAVLSRKVPMRLSDEEQVLFIWSDDCHICGKNIYNEDDKVRDHCHRTGEFRGAAHSKCNLKYQRAKHITVVFHNLSNYDSHFIIKAFTQNIDGEVSVIPRNDEVYISFSKHIDSTRNKVEGFCGVKLRFIDSLRFMRSSLDYLASTLPLEKKKILRAEFKDLNDEKMRLLQRKGVFCYDYLDSVEKLNETSLPPKEKFFNTLNNSGITDEEYAHAEKVWETFNIKTLGEYSDLYLKTDILLLADIFENFRDKCFSIYQLDPAHYFTAPGLSFDAMLKQTKVELDLITDVDMLLFIERGIRGGISQCSKRYARANNKYTENHDPELESNFLMYLDANNLYGWSMLQYLPHSDFRWNHEEFTAADIMALRDDSCMGYIFEVDLEYPQHLHDTHKDYPFCCENKTDVEMRIETWFSFEKSAQSTTIQAIAMAQAIH